MFSRSAEQELASLAKQYPVVTLLGPRQSGKTTLVRYLFPNKAYVNLESLDVQALAHRDPKGFLAQYPNGAILDEIQRAPQLLSYIQVIVDETNSKGLFILTGSHQLELHQAVSQSLAGRTALLQLLPMSLEELDQAGFDLSLNEYLWKGGYPRIFQDQLEPTKHYRHYFQTYVERDVRQLVQVKDLVQFQRFVKLCAGRIGSLLNLESLCNDIGISTRIAKEWLSILEASFILFSLQPYFENFGKRVIKSPKIYFYDVGLAIYLLGIETIEQLDRDPLRGHLIENLVLMELVKARTNRGLDPHLYFFRDVHGHEVDLIFQSGHKLIPIEIKASKTFNKEFLKNIDFFKKIVENRYEKGALIYTGEQEQEGEDLKILNYKHATRILR